MEKITARHILVETEEKAQELVNQLSDGGSFEELAKEHSKCPSGQQGGHLGEFTKGQMVKEFESAAFALDVNQVSGPVQTQFGYHVIQRTED